MYLHSGLAQAESLAELLPHECVRVVGLVEQSLQLAQLLQGEVGAAAAGLVVVAAAVAAVAVARHVLKVLGILGGVANVGTAWHLRIGVRACKNMYSCIKAMLCTSLSFIVESLFTLQQI